MEFIEQYVRDTYDLTPKGIIQSLGLLDGDYNKVSAAGHFGTAGLLGEEEFYRPPLDFIVQNRV